jgi:glycosyltransferase involved in cell wall biosynthesis
MTGRPRLLICPDFAEEGWPSMDRCAAMLVRGLEAEHADRLAVTRFEPRFRGQLGSISRNADRLLNRFWHYPRQLKRMRRQFDLFHIVDHSYSQLLHTLPPERTGVYCHDLDTFRCLLDPAAEPRPRWFRAMARRILGGFQKARMIFYSTQAVRSEIERHGLIDPSRLVCAPLGIDPIFRPADAASERPAEPFVLHVGSTIPRKRIDVLLEAFAALRASFPKLRLVQIGGTWTPPQQAIIDQHQLAEAIEQRRGIDEAELARLYQTAAVVMQTSDAEGFGLPVAEALACGAAVVASDIPALREVGGDAAVFVAPGDASAFAAAAGRILSDPTSAPPLLQRLAQASRFSWSSHCRIIADAYLRIT